MHGEFSTIPFDAILILEVFEKKTSKTPKSIIDICKQRIRRYEAEVKEWKKEIRVCLSICLSNRFWPWELTKKVSPKPLLNPIQRRWKGT